MSISHITAHKDGHQRRANYPHQCLTYKPSMKTLHDLDKNQDNYLLQKNAKTSTLSQNSEIAMFHVAQQGHLTHQNIKTK